MKQVARILNPKMMILTLQKKLVWSGFEWNTRTFRCRLKDKKVDSMKKAAQEILEEK
jgi:hypothetical protein